MESGCNGLKIRHLGLFCTWNCLYEGYFSKTFPSIFKGASWKPPPPPGPLWKGGGGVGPSENWVTWGVRNFWLERGHKPEKRDWCRNEGVATFLLVYSSITFTVCVGKVRFPLLLFGSSVFWVSYSRFSSMSLLY